MRKYNKIKMYLNGIRPAYAYTILAAVLVLILLISQWGVYRIRLNKISTDHEAQIETLREELERDYEVKIEELRQYYEYGGDVSQIEREAEYIAKVLYGTAANHADSDKKAVVWCVLNRVDHNSHPDTVEEVCEQPKQWMGYSSDNPVVADLYELALEELKVWHSGEHRPMNSSYIYLSWSSKEILLRDTFEVSKSTNYWRMR